MYYNVSTIGRGLTDLEPKIEVGLPSPWSGLQIPPLAVVRQEVAYCASPQFLLIPALSQIYCDSSQETQCVREWGARIRYCRICSSRARDMPMGFETFGLVGLHGELGVVQSTRRQRGW